MLGTLRRHQPLCNLNVLKLGFQPPAPRTTSPAMAMTGAATLKRLMRPIASGPGGGGGGTASAPGELRPTLGCQTADAVPPLARLDARRACRRAVELRALPAITV